MKKINYLIRYTVKNKNGLIIKRGEMRVKNKLSEFEAKCSFEEYLKRKHPEFGSLIIHECKVDFLGGLGNIFGKDNPFGF